MSTEIHNVASFDDLLGAVDPRCRLDNGRVCRVRLLSGMMVIEKGKAKKIDPEFLLPAYAEALSDCGGAEPDVSNECGFRGQVLLHCRHPSNNPLEITNRTIETAQVNQSVSHSEGASV